MEPLSIKDQEEKIKNLEKDIEDLEKSKSSYRFDIKELASKYKECGDKYINLYLSNYALCGVIEADYSEKSIKEYEEAIKLFNEWHFDSESIYATMALGNAYKEKFLPGMPKEEFGNLYTKSQEKYKKCVEFCFDNMEKYAQDYFFIMLEQINLLVRKRVWEYNLLPKRVNIFHSLKSPISHVTLEGLCYYSFLNNFEIWEYRYGKVRTFDEEKKFIEDRLNESCAVIILASDDYDYNKPIIKHEVGKLKDMIEKEDPFKVFIVDLGNEIIINEFRNFKDYGNCKVLEKCRIEEIFKNCYKIPNLYECLKVRLKGW